jgi:hypothetical protein
MEEKMFSKTMMNKKITIAIGLGAIFLIVLAGYFIIPRSRTPAYVITLTENGFRPDKVTIQKNDLIEFRTERNTYFWPASDLHPTHELYSGFDPQTPIDPDKSWEFQFNQTGEVRFHDHLAPRFTGRITVTE